MTDCPDCVCDEKETRKGFTQFIENSIIDEFGKNIGAFIV